MALPTDTTHQAGSAAPARMRAARLHEVGAPLVVDEIDIPAPRGKDVLVRVRACGIVPNLVNVMTDLANRSPYLSLPPLPAIFGLDAAGTVAAKGPQCHGVDLGQRVYVNPARSCGGCLKCRIGQTTSCDFFTFNGYFGFTPGSQAMFRDYAYGGLSEYLVAPQDSLVTLPTTVSFNDATRWGYIGTAYGALRRAGADMTTSVLINGVSGTLGLGALLSALALGVPRIFGVGRNLELLNKTKQLAPNRIEVLSSASGSSTAAWVAAATTGRGVDIAVDALNHGAPQEVLLDALGALGRGGRFVNIGGVKGPLPLQIHKLMARNQTFMNSLWFTTAQGQEMAHLAETGLLRTDVFEHRVYSLQDAAQALSSARDKSGGFTSVVVHP